MTSPVGFVPQYFPLYAHFDRDDWHNHQADDCASITTCVVIGWVDDFPVLHELFTVVEGEGDGFMPINVGTYQLYPALPSEAEGDEFMKQRCTSVRSREASVPGK